MSIYCGFIHQNGSLCQIINLVIITAAKNQIELAFTERSEAVGMLIPTIARDWIPIIIKQRDTIEEVFWAYNLPVQAISRHLVVGGSF